MRIDNDSDRNDTQSTIRDIEEYQQQQQLDQVQDEQRRLDQQQHAAVDDVQELPDPDTLAAGDPTQDPTHDATAVDIQGQLQAQTVADVNASRELSGTEKTDGAIDAASIQQDRGEQWMSFSATQEVEQLPPTPEELARQNADDNAQQEKNRISVQEMINQMTIQSGRING